MALADLGLIRGVTGVPGWVLAGPPFIRASDLKSRTRSKNGSLPMRGRTLSESSPTHAYAVYLGSSRGMQGHEKIRYLLGALAASAHPVALVLGHGGEVEQNKVHDEVIYTPRRFLESTVVMGFATELLSNLNRMEKSQ